MLARRELKRPALGWLRRERVSSVPDVFCLFRCPISSFPGRVPGRLDLVASLAAKDAWADVQRRAVVTANTLGYVLIQQPDTRFRHDPRSTLAGLAAP